MLNLEVASDGWCELGGTTLSHLVCLQALMLPGCVCGFYGHQQ